MGNSARIFLVALLLMLSACGGGSGGSGGSDGSGGNSSSLSQQQSAKSLSIRPIAQEEPDWCYAASTQMIFAYYGLPAVNSVDYQCGIVGMFNEYSIPQCFIDCQFCAQVGGGTMDAIKQLVDLYGVIASQDYFIPSPVLVSSEMYSPLSLQQVETEIDAGRPILAGISPGQFPLPDVSQHAVVVVGYNINGSSALLIVNDPFPYAATFQQDPYTPAGGTLVQPGQYSISYDAFVQELVWANTLYDIHVN